MTQESSVADDDEKDPRRNIRKLLVKLDARGSDQEAQESMNPVNETIDKKESTTSIHQDSNNVINGEESKNSALEQSQSTAEPIDEQTQPELKLNDTYRHIPTYRSSLTHSFISCSK